MPLTRLQFIPQCIAQQTFAHQPQSPLQSFIPEGKLKTVCKSTNLPLVPVQKSEGFYLFQDCSLRTVYEEAKETLKVKQQKIVQKCRTNRFDVGQIC
ncbi:hypothetical protein H6P81_019334 [Aristolochia fimbriata]|uniref:Uncharacterized protein n=1 Tax=Aristolochia fimbriata TaxID=158543 RepID=A0AAV7DSA8_ARIFI|nr:hypothetical protein H6P81_019334 [Aristolochia fimbriata]